MWHGVGWVRWQRDCFGALEPLPICRLCSVLMVEAFSATLLPAATPGWTMDAYLQNQKPSKPLLQQAALLTCFFTVKGRKVTSTLHRVRQLGSEGAGTAPRSEEVKEKE